MQKSFFLIPALDSILPMLDILAFFFQFRVLENLSLLSGVLLSIRSPHGRPEFAVGGFYF